MSANAFSPQGNTGVIDCTDTASTGKQIKSAPTGQSGALVYNQGPNDAYLCHAAAATAAVVPSASVPANGQPIPAGAVLTLTFPPDTFFSGICDSGKTAKLFVTRGEGN